MSKLTSKQRSAIPTAKFAGPNRSYPITDRGHAIAAKSDASRAVNSGRMSAGTEKHIDSKADAMLRKGSR